MHLLDTGLETQTGGRIKRAAGFIGDETFMLTYGDGVADVDIRALLEFHRSHGQARDGHRRAAARALRRAARSTDEPRRGVRRRSRSSAKAGSTAASSCSSPASLDYIDGDDMPFEREPLERLAADGQLAAYRHEGFWQPMDTHARRRAARASCGTSGTRSVEGVGRERYATGSTGPCSSPARQGCSAAGSSSGLLASRANVVCLVRDWVPQSELVRSGAARRRHRRARRHLRRSSCSSARSASTRSTPSSTSPRRRSSASPTATPISTFETNIARHLAAARGLPAQPARPVDRRRLVATRPTASTRSCRTPRTRRSQGATRTTSASRAPT